MQNMMRFVILSESVKVETYRNTHTWNTAVLVDYLTGMNYFDFVCVDLVVHTNLNNYSLDMVTSDLISSSQGWAHGNAVNIHSERSLSYSIFHFKGIFPLSTDAKRHQAFNIGIQKDLSLNTYMDIKYLYFA